MSLKRIWAPSPNYSSRGGASVRLIVIHSSEGSTSGAGLGNFFANPSSGVSSHTGIDDTPGTVWEYVKREQKSWTAASANPVAVQTELCCPSGASAGWSVADWNSHPNMLANCAAWIAEEAAAFGIPIVALSPNQAQGSGRGVCQHKDLGAWGGGHSDCGPNFPIGQVVALAAGQPAPTPPDPTPTPTTGDENMVLTDPTTGGHWVVVPDAIPAAIWTYGGAPYLGATNSAKFNAAKYPCVGISRYVDSRGEGYTLCLDWGDGGGGKSKDGTGPRHRFYSFPRDGSGK